MAPVRRVTHLLGICSFAIVYAMLRSVIILVAIALAFHLDLSHADIGSALLVLAAATFPVLGLGIFTSILPAALAGEGRADGRRGAGGAAARLGRVLPDHVLPAVLRVMGQASPLTYTLSGIRSALLDHAGIGSLLGTILVLLVMGAVLIPGGVLGVRARRAAREAARAAQAQRV